MINKNLITIGAVVTGTFTACALSQSISLLPSGLIVSSIAALLHVGISYERDTIKESLLIISLHIVVLTASILISATFFGSLLALFIAGTTTYTLITFYNIYKESKAIEHLKQELKATKNKIHLAENDEQKLRDKIKTLHITETSSIIETAMRGLEDLEKLFLQMNHKVPSTLNELKQILAQIGTLCSFEEFDKATDSFVSSLWENFFKGRDSLENQLKKIINNNNKYLIN